MTAILIDLSTLSRNDLEHFANQSGLGARRLEHPFAAAAFAGLLRAADDEARRRLAIRPAFPHRVTLPIDPDADPLTTDLALEAMLDVSVRLRDRSAAPGGRLSGLWGEIVAQLAELRDQRRRQSGEVASLLGSRPHV